MKPRSKTTRPRGRCQVCDRHHVTRKDGTLQVHQSMMVIDGAEVLMHCSGSRCEPARR